MLFPEELINFILRFVPIAARVVSKERWRRSEIIYEYADLNYFLEGNYENFGDFIVEDGCPRVKICNYHALIMIRRMCLGSVDHISSFYPHDPHEIHEMKHLFKHLRVLEVEELEFYKYHQDFDKIICHQLDKLKINGFDVSIFYGPESLISNSELTPKALYMLSTTTSSDKYFLYPLKEDNYTLEKFEIDTTAILMTYDLAYEIFDHILEHTINILTGWISKLKRLKKLNLQVYRGDRDSKKWEKLFDACPSLQTMKIKEHGFKEVYRVISREECGKTLDKKKSCTIL